MLSAAKSITSRMATVSEVHERDRTNETSGVNIRVSCNEVQQTVDSLTKNVRLTVVRLLFAPQFWYNRSTLQMISNKNEIAVGCCHDSSMLS